MDTRYFGTNLTVFAEGKAPRRLPKLATEDAYYGEYDPKNSRFFKISAVVTAVWFGFAAIGLLLH
jgi:hypothetical protein